jgi:hypothetical protein
MIDVSKLTNTIRRIFNIPKPPIITSLGVKMRSPINNEGKWIGWTGEEVAAHLHSVRSYAATLPPKPEEKDRGCGRS